jgi:FMN phosphatase YigB (HAD superfamily)
MARPQALLLDAGGIFLLPDPDRIVAAFARARVEVAAAILPEAHYRAAATFDLDLDLDADWAGAWQRYLDVYVDAAAPDAEDRDEIHAHVDPEFADAALWRSVIPGAKEDLGKLAATGLRLGVVSNADGLMASRLRDLEILQVGPGPGVEVECVVDSGAVGVMKPDPRIFDHALDALGLTAEEVWYVGDMPAFDIVGARRAGIRPFVLDPAGLHVGADYDRVPSLAAFATLIDR